MLQIEMLPVDRLVPYIRNAENAGWDDALLRSELATLQEADFDLGLIGFDETELDEIMAGFEGFGMGGGDGAAAGYGQGGGGDDHDSDDGATANATLAERFGIPPFSVFEARKGWWQDRKRAWLDLGIRSELGRGAAPSIAVGRARSLSPRSLGWAPPTRRRSTSTSTIIATRRASAPARRPLMDREV